MIKLLVHGQGMEIQGYKTYTSVKTFLQSSLSDVALVVYHSCTDSLADTTRFLGVLAGKKDLPIIYCNNELDPLLRITFENMGADVYDNEGILTDRATLNFCLKRRGSCPLAVKSTGKDITKLDKFIADISEDKGNLMSYANNPLWLKALSSAVMSVKQQLMMNKQAASQLVGVFNNIDASMTVLTENNNVIEDELVELKKNLVEAQANYKALMAAQASKNKETVMSAPIQKNVITSFPVYEAKPSVKPTAYISVRSHCPYLMSFICHFAAAMPKLKTKGKQVRVLMLLPQAAVWTQYYKQFKCINPNVISFENTQSTDMVFWTSQPTSQVWDYFFDNPDNFAAYIVVDFTMDSPLLKSGKATYMQAGMGTRFLSLPAMAKVPPELTIFGVEGDEKGIVIPTMPGYRAKKEANLKAAEYLKAFKTTAYERMAAILKL